MQNYDNNDLASDRQISYMKTLGYTGSTKITRGEADAWIKSRTGQQQATPAPNPSMENYDPVNGVYLETPTEVPAPHVQSFVTAPKVNVTDPERAKLNTLFQMAKIYAASTIVPQCYRNNEGNCFIAIQMASRMGADPFQVMQNLYVIQGNPSWSSKFIISCINQSRRFKTNLAYKVGGSAATGDLWCTAYAVGFDGELYEGPKVTWEMVQSEGWANKNGSKWKTMPEIMIRYRAASFFGKLYCPDLLLGIMSTEEAREVIDAEYTETDERKYDNTADVNKAQRASVATTEVDNDLSALGI